VLRALSIVCSPLLVLLSPLAQAADAMPVGIVADTCPSALVMPDSVRAMLTELFMEPRTLAAADIQRLLQDPDFDAFNAASRGLGAQQDWPNLCRFSSANAAAATSAEPPALVFMGDSITENWLLGDPALFDGANLNRGIGGQTTPQMLLRFRADVVALRPRAVHIMAGTNDVAGNTGPTTLQDVKNNLMSMVELARAQGIAVLLGSIPPAAAFDWRPGLDPRPVINELNHWLREYAAANNHVYLDYHAALADANGALRSDYGNDGVHPNRAGYAVMRAVLAPHLAVESLQLQAGAARIDMTPALDALPAHYRGISDPVYARAIVLDNGITRAALVSLDAGGIPTDLWREVSTRVEQELGIPATQFLLGATHTHSVPRQSAPDFADKLVQSVRDAAARLQPARMAWGTGVSFINVNRTMVNPQTGLWDEGANYDGPSDKTVAVLSFDTLEGEPIAVYYNYAVHAVISGQLDEVSGDIPGASSRYIEESLGGAAVALWSLGAAGDQNPIFFQQTHDLRQIRIDDYASRGEDISNSMPPGGVGLDRSDPVVARLMNQQRQMQVSMGQLLGEEVLHVRRTGLERPLQQVAIRGGLSTLTCPARRRLDSGREGSPGIYEPADPVDLQLGLLRLGDVQLGSVNAEIFNPIALRLKQESPWKHTMLVTLANGMAPTGYVPHDAAFGYQTFEVLSSRLQQGCAEGGIVNGLLDLMTDLNN